MAKILSTVNLHFRVSYKMNKTFCRTVRVVWPNRYVYFTSRDLINLINVDTSSCHAIHSHYRRTLIFIGYEMSQA